MGFLDNIKTIVGNKPAQSQAVSTSPTPAAKKVLVVEDDQYIRDLYFELLATAGYQAFKAVNGQEGLNLVLAQKPNLVLTDIMMPVMDGKAMVHAIRQIPEFKLLPIIALTNAGDVDTMKEMRMYENVSEFLIKSNVTPQDILDKVKMLI